MKKYQKAIASLIAVLVVVVGAGGPVMASDRVFNRNTGWRSHNKAKIKKTKRASLAVVQLAEVANVVMTSGNTGGNRSSANVKGGKVESGDVETTVDNTSFVNESVVSLKQTDEACDCGDLAYNEQTGARSHNKAQIKKSKRAAVLVVQAAEVSNSVVSHSNTGRNRANANTKGGEVKTGDVDTTVTNYNDVNSSTVAVRQ